MCQLRMAVKDKGWVTDSTLGEVVVDLVGVIESKSVVNAFYPIGQVKDKLGFLYL